MDLNKLNKLADAEFEGAVAMMSVFTILSGGKGIKGKIDDDKLAVLGQLYIAVWNFFINIAAIKSKQ